jgi:uncharacterized protein (TIGR03089 family)
MPTTVLAEILRADPARPRLTFYDDGAGERIELSAKVLANWVNKAANALQDEFDVGPGAVVRLGLPALHWRAFYWALAVWSVGATVDVTASPDGPVGLLITDQTDADVQADATVLVTLAALARRHPGPAPAGVFDDARDLATYGDQFTAWDEPTPDSHALVTPRGVLTYGQVVPSPDWPAGSRVRIVGDRTTALRDGLAAWAGGGSIVLVTDPDPGTVASRLASEGVTIDLGS